MNKFNRKHLIAFIAICIVGCIIPFVTKTKDESLNSTLSTAFTVVSTIVAIVTLIVAVILIDRYGFDAKFKEKQLDIVLQFINELKLLDLAVSNGKFTYINYVRHCNDLEMLLKIYQNDKAKVLLFPQNFQELLHPINSLLKNYWMPPEIKEKADFLVFYMVKDIAEIDYSQFLKLEINSKGTEPMLETLPKVTFEMFSTGLSVLITTTLKWIQQHSTIAINFDLMGVKE